MAIPTVHLDHSQRLRIDGFGYGFRQSLYLIGLFVGRFVDTVQIRQSIR